MSHNEITIRTDLIDPHSYLDFRLNIDLSLSG